ncbi:hypothetical protein CgunFtcFv8_024299 [Champsocephalus gunnari]|uniref:Uncharacterized protein n=1 Tax=Champsocephalus gunnari TaxID=52237 RepID=A0AAN8HL61_CHAGU|nr:hypothetical protein CgunFtcFv8_024299 [Champsocephalus gunnari]
MWPILGCVHSAPRPTGAWTVSLFYATPPPATGMMGPRMVLCWGPTGWDQTKRAWRFTLDTGCLGRTYRFFLSCCFQVASTNGMRGKA